ncbi:MAG TPA: hypothetical protein VFG99_07050, partial [Chloroflexia bacterium]|nr:hypothetical protein [Chloroflexia bacterium]
LMVNPVIVTSVPIIPLQFDKASICFNILGQGCVKAGEQHCVGRFHSDAQLRISSSTGMFHLS